MKHFFVVAAAIALIASSCALKRDTAVVSTNLHVSVVFGLERKQAELDKAALEVNTPTNKSYAKYLAPADIASRFGAPKADRDKVVDFLRKSGAKVLSTTTGGLVATEMTTSQVAEILHVRYKKIVNDDGTVELAASKPKVPGELKGIIKEIVGLDRTDNQATTPTPAGDVGEGPDQGIEG